MCFANMKQFGAGALMYASDFGDVLFPDQARNAQGRRVVSGDHFAVLWAYAPDPDFPANQLAKARGLLYPYVASLDRIGECPTNKRKMVGPGPAPRRWSAETDLDFDCTFLQTVGGASTHANIRVGYLTNPTCSAQIYPEPFVTFDDQNAARRLTFFHSLPIFIEKDAKFFNASWPDGLFCVQDQVATRLARSGTHVRLDGPADLLAPPQAGRADVAAAGDLIAADWYVQGLRFWVRLEPDDIGEGCA